MDIFIIILLFIAAYLLGSIPGGYLLTTFIKNDDIRKYGSNSTGATNATRVLGIGYGILAGLIDVLKGMIVPSILMIFNLTNYSEVIIANNVINILPLYGIFAVIGHIFPLYLNFKGGKAVATSFGLALLFSPYLALLGVVAFIIIFLITKYVSLGSIFGSTIILIATFIFYLLEIPLLGRPIIEIEVLITYFILVGIIWIRHIPNIKRLLKGEENRVKRIK